MKILSSLTCLRFIILCLLMIFMLVANSCKKKKLFSEGWAQDSFECGAEFLRSRAPIDANSYPELFQRTKDAIEMVSNGVLDERVIILNAHVGKMPSQYTPYPSVADSPSFILFVVDELKQIAHINYIESTDPNALGDTMFSLCNYFSLFGRRSSHDLNPVYHWSLYLKAYDIHNFSLLKNQYDWSSSWAVLEVPQSKFNSLVANRGQIILYDKDYELLDRFILRPPPENEQSNISENKNLKTIGIH